MSDPAVIVEYRNPKERLGHAVHRHKPVSREGLTERFFTLLFTGLVYPQIWEDPEVDMKAMAIEPGQHVVAIASGGCNVMSYLSADPGRITALDLNPAHIALNKLKREAALRLPSYEHFRSFFGDADSKRNVELYETFLRDRLDPDTRRYWEKRSISGRRRITLFARGFYRHGLLGSFIGAAHLAAKFYGVRLADILELKSVEDQRRYFDEKLAPLFDRKLVSWITSKPASLYGLGIPPSQYEALAGGREMREVLRERLETLTCDFPIEDNYFAWQAFARRYGPDSAGSLPPYLKRENFSALQARADRVEVLNKSFTEFLRSEPDRSADRYVLLDAQDWMTDEQLNDLWTQITRTARSGARVIFRTAAEPTLLPGRVSDDILARWRYHEADSARFTKEDRSSIYGGFHLYELES